MNKLFNKQIKSGQEGFTLVELMIVVAIIGILASIAIPNYQKYQAKARTSEGKIQLAAAYTAQKSFYIEYSSYTGCLGNAGYAPDLGIGNQNTSKRYYAVGFSLLTAGGGCGPNAGSACEAAWGNGNTACAVSVDGASGLAAPTYYSASISTPPNGGTNATAADITGTAATSTTFILGASGRVNQSANTVDKWTINESKVLSQTAVGY